MGFFNFWSKKENTNSNLETALDKIEVENGLLLPRAFADHWEEIKKTGIDYIEIKAVPSQDITAMESSFGSMPFIPVGFNYPLDSNNNPMLPLAQLNFAEMPFLPDYPTKGLLQFYIADDDCYGLDFDNQYNPASFRVIYIEKPEDLEMATDMSFIKTATSAENSPVFKPHKLSFSKKTDYIGTNDYRSNLHDFSVDDWVESYKGDVHSKLSDAAYDLFCTNGHKVGGYAYFTQSDPREYNEKARDTILLFQMDSDDEIMWGDVGVANFFITRQDLINKDFSKVMYNWDCC